jgi:hypothetical protein
MTVPVTTLIETYEELRDEWKTTHCGDESEESRSAIAMAVLMAAQNQEDYESIKRCARTKLTDFQVTSVK